MEHRFTDTLTLDGTRKREAGYLVADAKIARTGIQTYAGYEVGKPDMRTVRVYRAPEQVFSADSMKSFAHIPVTNDHPAEPVNASNWAKYAKGHTSGDVSRDGETLRVPLMVSDQAVIDQIDAGKRELSNGYVCELDWAGGVTPDGQTYDAAQINIRGNHVAVVTAGRAGYECRIGDNAHDGGKDRANWGSSPLTNADKKDVSMTLRTILVDGLSVETTDQGAQAIDKLQGMIADMKAESKAKAKAREDEKEEDDKKFAKKDAEISDLKAKVLDAKAVDALVEKRAKLLSDAKTAAPDVKTDGLSDADIRKAVVTAVRGADAIADKSGAYIDAAFDIIIETAGAGKSDAFRDASLNTERKPAGDAIQARDAAHAEYVAGLNTAHLPAQKGA